ncbi:hypothetical protein [Paraburkholderia sp.]|uniref:hypothetical protein n=1 Tax=Paraburkholderia sp. TaxID=1926495 RepID=UPI003C7A7285
MSFVLHLGDNGVYTKHDGAPLIPCQEVLLNDGLFNLPRRFEQTDGEILIVRSWRIPTRGGHYLLREFLPRDKSKGWPWKT